MAKAGTDFEVFTKILYEEILNQQDLKNLKVEHNIKLKGLSQQEHQIDVYWEFEIAGTVHKVAVECKDYKNQVSIGKIRDFSAILDDIGGIKGIFVTKKGYQSGAIKFAQAKKIDLKIIKDENITQNDFKGSGLVTSIRFRSTALMIDNVNFVIEYDKEFLFKDNATKVIQIEISCTNDEIYITNSKKEKIFSLYELEKQLPREPSNTKNLKFTKDLTDNTYFLEYPNRKHELKVNKIHYLYDTVSYKNEYTIEAKATAKAIIRDLIKDTCEVIGIKKIP
jgi:hypothetical protein